jgi:hypothetical protein
MAIHTNPDSKIAVTDPNSSKVFTEIAVSDNSKTKNLESEETIQDCLIFKQKQENIAMAVLTSFWWMFDYSIEVTGNHVSYGDSNYVEAFIETWQNFMLDLEDKNEELHSILSELTDKQIREVAGE